MNSVWLSTNHTETAFGKKNILAIYFSQRLAAPLLEVLLFISFFQREGWDCREKRNETHHPSPWDRQRPRKPVSREAGRRRRTTGDSGEERWGGGGWSAKMCKRSRWRRKEGWCQRRLMDKRACESMLGGQTRCQTHKHQTQGEQGGWEREGFIESMFGRVLLL